MEGPTELPVWHLEVERQKPQPERGVQVSQVALDAHASTGGAGAPLEQSCGFQAQSE